MTERGRPVRSDRASRPAADSETPAFRRIVFITPPDARYGFSLAGVRQVVPAADQVETALHDVTSDPEVGLVVIDERLMDEQQLAALERPWNGVIVILPAPEAAERVAEDYAMRLIRQTIGYQVRVNP